MILPGPLLIAPIDRLQHPMSCQSDLEIRRLSRTIPSKSIPSLASVVLKTRRTWRLDRLWLRFGLGVDELDGWWKSLDVAHGSFEE